MALKSIEAEAVGTAATQLVDSLNGGAAYQVGAGNRAAFLALHCTNRHTDTITVDAYVKRGSKTLYIVKGANIVVGGAENFIDGKRIGIPGDQIWVKSSVASSLDVACDFDESAA